MKRELLVTLAALLAVSVFVVWRQARTEDEVREIRQMLHERVSLHKDATTPIAQPRIELPAENAATSEEWQALRDEAARNSQKLAELEGVVTEIANLLNGMLDEADQKKAAANRKSWSAGQACGPPDTSEAGDLPTAWAPARQNGGEEWLQLEYGEPLQIGQIVVRETYHPGAIFKVTVVLDGGGEVPIWQGTEPSASAPVDRQFPVASALTGHTVKVYLDTSRVSGWNEIDAVALVTPDGQRHWATDASASSSYGDSQLMRDSIFGDTLQSGTRQYRPSFMLR